MCYGKLLKAAYTSAKMNVFRNKRLSSKELVTKVVLIPLTSNWDLFINADPECF